MSAVADPDKEASTTDGQEPQRLNSVIITTMIKALSDNRPSTNRSSSRLILASESPRRAELLRENKYSFDVIRPPLGEPAALADGQNPMQLAEALSFYKARSVASHVITGVILAADTVSVLNGRVFGKPCDRADAARILATLMGTTHQVITGVTVLDAASMRRRIVHDITHVTMRAMSDAELQAYLDSDAWMGKAGAYGIQDHGDQFVTKCQGSFTNVVGLPMELVMEMLAEFGCRPDDSAASEPPV